MSILDLIAYHRETFFTIVQVILLLILSRIVLYFLALVINALFIWLEERKLSSEKTVPETTESPGQSNTTIVTQDSNTNVNNNNIRNRSSYELKSLKSKQANNSLLADHLIGELDNYLDKLESIPEDNNKSFDLETIN